MAVDIVINWAAEGVVLCFIHAVVDLHPRDNDEQHKTGWTNWCGTPYMGMEQVDVLHQRLRQVIPQPPSKERVFQILLNQPDRPLWFSWPPDHRNQVHGPWARDFAQLAADVNINNQAGDRTDAKTSCTRRFKAMQKMEWTESPTEVESIFIPYGEPLGRQRCCLSLSSVVCRSRVDIRMLTRRTVLCRIDHIRLPQSEQQERDCVFYAVLRGGIQPSPPPSHFELRRWGVRRVSSSFV